MEEKKPDPVAKATGGAASVYGELVADREPYLRRAWECAELTIPSILPRNGERDQELPTPFQNVGARGVNNLSSKSVITLFPTNTPFFKQVMDELFLKKLENDGEKGKNLRTEFEAALGTMERVAMQEVEVSGDRAVLFEVFKHVYVAGNVLLFKDKPGLRCFHLDRYVVRRDPSGNVLEIVVEEEVDPVTLPEEIRKVAQENATDTPSKNRCIKLYTHVKRLATHWSVQQEISGQVIEKTKGTYPLDRCPWIAVRFTRIDGENYGRGYVEEYLGDFRSLENLTAAIVQGAAAAAKVLFLVKPNSSTKIKVLTEAPNGAVRAGNAEDVTVLRLDKQQDFQTALVLAQNFEQRLSQSFMLASSIQRDAERVTAEEIRQMIGEMEQVLGGFYSILSIELQLPYVKVLLAMLQRSGRLPHLPKGMVRPSIVTGIEGLGRGQDLNKIKAYMQDLFETMTPQIAARFVNYAELATRLATARGIDTKNLIKTAEEIAEEDRKAQMQEMVKTLGPQAVNALGGAAKERIKQDGAGQAAGAGNQPSSPGA